MSAPARSGGGPPDDADDLRGFHFRQLLATGTVRVGIVAAAAVGGIAGAAIAGPAAGAAGFAVGLLTAMIVAFVVADSRSEAAFFQIYGSRRGMHQLFSPSFIVWLSEAPPEKFAFELVDGNLCCYVDDHKKKTVELDILRASTAAIAARLREEALE